MMIKWTGVCPECHVKMRHIGGSGAWQCVSPSEDCPVWAVKLKQIKADNGPFMYVIDRIIYETVAK